uniref:Uncharacterized protein n=1 Tax=Oryza sativa subsp. japonica TaxID=39947 RepID=Q6YSA0_ORYSJ|nr:hypothetical protein [Oryza sativa Japonica Group]BAD10783.1 hypothetical protein [Oryza sativa Japonica Group]
MADGGGHGAAECGGRSGRRPTSPSCLFRRSWRRRRVEKEELQRRQERGAAAGGKEERKQAAASPTSEEQGRCLPISIPKNENADDDGTELSCLICLIGSAA